MSVLNTFTELSSKMNDDPVHLEGIDYVYQFNLTGDDEGTYQIKIKNKQVHYCQGEKWEPKLTLEMSDESFIKLSNDNLNPTIAYMSGKLKVHGDLGHALKLQALIKKYS